MLDFHWPYLIAWVVSVAIIIWRYETRIKSLNKPLNEHQSRSFFLEEELAACRNKLLVETRKNDIKTENITFEKNVDFAEETKAINTKNDLKIVEGIGPKIENLLNAQSIFTFDDLSKTDVVELKKILEKAGSRYTIHNPSTWPKQAELAHLGKWDELKKWQNELDKGRIVQ